MNLNKFTLKAQEAIQKSLEIAQEHQHQAVENQHLFLALLDPSQETVGALLAKLEVPKERVRLIVQEALKSLPKVSGASVSTPYLGSSAKKVMDQCAVIASKLGDEYISTEHILMGIVEAKESWVIELQKEGLEKKRIEHILHELRGGQKVDDPNAESRFAALKKYARDLNEWAEKNKLDPVIGRDAEIRRVMQILSRRTKNNRSRGSFLLKIKNVSNLDPLPPSL